jgi:hypothetical protein
VPFHLAHYHNIVTPDTDSGCRCTTRQLAAKSPMLEDRPHANAGVAGFFYTLRLDKTMIDRISIPHLIFEDTYPLLLILSMLVLIKAWMPYSCTRTACADSQNKRVQGHMMVPLRARCPARAHGIRIAPLPGGHGSHAECSAGEHGSKRKTKSAQPYRL